CCSVRQPLLPQVRHSEPQRMTASGPDKGSLNRFHPVLPISEGFRGELLNGIAHMDRTGLRCHGEAKADSHGIRKLPRHFPEETSALKTEDAAPQAVEVGGDDGCIDALHDLFEAT